MRQNTEDFGLTVLALFLLGALVVGLLSTSAEAATSSLQKAQAAAKAQETVWFRWTAPTTGGEVNRYETFAQSWTLGSTDTTYSFRHISPDTTAPVTYTQNTGLRVRVRGIGVNGVEGTFSPWSESYYGSINILPGRPGKPAFFKIELGTNK